MPACPPTFSVSLLCLVALCLGGCGAGPGTDDAPPPPSGLHRQADLIDVTPGAGQFCGGLLAPSCQKGFACEDDPQDDCDPSRGDSDCLGVCMKAPPRAPGPVDCELHAPPRHYVERDPQVCAALLYLCHADETHFHDECGCGCTPAP